MFVLLLWLGCVCYSDVLGEDRVVGGRFYWRWMGQIRLGFTGGEVVQWKGNWSC